MLLFCLAAAPATVLGAGLSALLAHLRATQGANEERDAGPELTPVKQAQREWIERQLPAEPTGTNADGGVDRLDSDDLVPLALRMNQQLTWPD